MAKCTPKMIQTICDLIETGEHTIESVCKIVGIGKVTFYDWKKNNPNFSNALKNTEEKRLENLVEMAKSGLAKLLDIHEYDETKIEYTTDKDGKPKIKSKTTTKKKIMPNPTAVIFTLTNRESEKWRNSQSIDHTSNGKGFFDYLKETS